MPGVTSGGPGAAAVGEPPALFDKEQAALLAQGSEQPKGWGVQCSPLCNHLAGWVSLWDGIIRARSLVWPRSSSHTCLCRRIQHQRERQHRAAAESGEDPSPPHIQRHDQQAPQRHRSAGAGPATQLQQLRHPHLPGQPGVHQRPAEARAGDSERLGQPALSWPASHCPPDPQGALR